MELKNASKNLKFFICFLLFLFFNLFLGAYSSDSDSKLITLIYLNGSNDYNAQNRLKFKDSFYKNVYKMHPNIIEQLSKDELIKNRLLNDEYKFNSEPVVFYWGDKSVYEVEKIDKGLKTARTFSPKIAQAVREVFANCLHDAIWVQKTQNMSNILKELDAVVKEQTKNDNKVILLGYSAGSFITYQYFINKSNFIDINEFINLYEKKDIKNALKQYSPPKPACLDALLETQIVSMNSDGLYNLNPNKNIIINNYPKIDEYTNNLCFSSNSIKGVINFASPLILFYSEITDNSTNLNHLSQLMFKNVIENDIFFLTLNYRNDPLGYPVEKNISINDIKEFNPNLASKIKPNNGFVYNNSNIYVPRTFLSAHLAYWSTPKRFAKNIVKTYKNGYFHFYNLDN